MTPHYSTPSAIGDLPVLTKRIKKEGDCKH